LHTHIKPRNAFCASYLFYCIVIYFICIIIFYFTYIYTLCLTTTRWSWVHKMRKLFCRLLEEERRELSRLFSESSILNPGFSHGKNLLLLQHSALGVPTSWHLCLVLSASQLLISYHRVKKLFSWNGLKAVVEDFVRHCQVCQHTKHEQCKVTGKLQPLQILAAPWQDT
jgi:hypothetical protein